MSQPARAVALHPHPLTPVPNAAIRVCVTVTPESGGALALAYRLEGAIDALRIPGPREPGFEDGLWAHTCFEAFARTTGAAPYREYNFAPSRRWAAYAFDDYRARHVDWTPPATPELTVTRAADALTVHTLLPAPLLPHSPIDAGLELALTAVIEYEDGTLTYWALKHGADRPDFHRADGFALSIVPTPPGVLTEGAPTTDSTP